MKLILHIGSGKTGTSSIQKKLKSLQKNDELKGVTYLGLFFEELKNFKIERDEEAPQFFSKMKNSDQTGLVEISKNALIHAKEAALDNGCETVIWSNESLFPSISYFQELMPFIKENFNVEVIVYLRRQDKWFKSAYEQWNIKHKTYSGEYKSFEQWFSSRERSGFYEARLLSWEDMVGKDKLNVRAYDALDNVVDDFMNFANIDYKSPVQSKRDNTKKPTAFLSLYELYSSVSLDKQYPKEINSILENIPTENMNYDRATIDGMSVFDLGDNILDKFEEENQRISDRYEIPFNKECWDLDEQPTKGGKASLESIMSVLVRVLIDQNNRIKELESKQKN